MFFRICLILSLVGLFHEVQAQSVACETTRCSLPEAGLLEMQICPSCNAADSCSPCITPDDSVFIKVEGFFTSTCWEAAVLDSYTVSGSYIDIYSHTKHTPGYCLQILVPFSFDIPVGKLPVDFYYVTLIMDLNSPVYLYPVYCFSDFVVDTVGYKPGDINGDWTVNLVDIIYLYRFLFLSYLSPKCVKAGDANGDCNVDIGDVAYLVDYIYKGGPAPVPYCSNPQAPSDPGAPDTVWLDLSGGFGNKITGEIYIRTDNTVQAFSLPFSITGSGNLEDVDTTFSNTYSGTAVEFFDLLSVNTYPAGLPPDIPTQLALGGIEFGLGLGPGTHKIGKLTVNWSGDFCPDYSVQAIIDTFSSQYLSLELVSDINTIPYTPVFLRGDFFVLYDPCYIFSDPRVRTATLTAGTQGEVRGKLEELFCPVEVADVSYTMNPAPSTKPEFDTLLSQNKDTLTLLLNWTPCAGDTGNYTIQFSAAGACPETVLVKVVPPSPTSNLRGDANSDSSRNLVDIIYLVNYVFKGGCGPITLCLGDATNDSKVNLADIVRMVNYVFKGAPAPMPDC